MTNKELKAKLSAVGVSVKYDEGEYRVCVRGGSEATAYYTNDKEDAYHTGLAMAAKRDEKVSADFHQLTSSQVDQLLEEADRVRYRKPKNANGSRARYFHALLQRRAR